jgi:hypothetical protein
MRRRTDDQVYQQKTYYRGWAGFTMPVDVTYPQLFFGGAVVVGLDAFTAVAVNPWAMTVSTVIAVWIVVTVNRRVTPDRPISKVVRTGIRDFRRRPTPTEREPETVTLSTRHLRNKGART